MYVDALNDTNENPAGQLDEEKLHEAVQNAGLRRMFNFMMMDLVTGTGMLNLCLI